MTYCCDHCKKNHNESPWIHFFNSQGTEIKLCSYLCDTYYPIRYQWKHVQNKDDFDTLLPIINEKPKNPLQLFTILSEEVIDQLDDKEYYEYMDDLDDFQIFYPERYELLMNLQNTDNSDDEFNDDDEFESYYDI